MPTLRDLALHATVSNLTSLLNYLSEPVRDGLGELAWRYPRLENLDVASNDHILPHVLQLLQRRCSRARGDNDGLPEPITLATLKMGGSGLNDELRNRIVVVGGAKVIQCGREVIHSEENMVRD